MSIQKHLLLSALLVATLCAFAQGIPADQWTPSERQFVENAKNLYQQQGIQYTNEQASIAVQQMRQKQNSATRGIPESEWTPQEKSFVEASRRQYATSGVQFSPEQARLSVHSMREQIAKFTGAAGAMQVIASGNVSPAFEAPRPQPSVPAASAASEEQLAREISSWQKTNYPLSIKGRRDGFDINGRPVLDPEGTIFNYAFDVNSGFITYAVRTSRGVTIKTISAAPNSQPLVIASGNQGRSGWELQTTTGKQLSGSTLSLLSDGFLVGRSSSAFRYQSGKGVQSVAIPDGYFITPLQHGNVGATGYVLLEKEGATGGNDPVAGLFSSAKAIGSILGVNKKEDYFLMNVSTGKLFPINVAADGKQVTLMSQCRQVNWAISDCQKAQTFESVFGTDGMKNNSHYYWLVNWVGTPSGPVAFTLEDGLRKLYVTDLSTGKKVLAFERTFGIADWNIEQAGDARVSVKAKLAFEWKEIPDAVALLQSTNF
ncbi:hypothetical protein os4_08910 [Comamonadaceae bacterium OS-4]|nr:hypothetical protein os4_08910 [Comamonadaceae bacterium OS-4]